MANSDNVIKNLSRLKDKLLDLGKRNQMLFLKPKSKRIIEIQYPNWREIHRLISEGENLRLVRKIDQLSIEEKETLINSLKPQKQTEENIYSNEDINLTKQDIPFELIRSKLKENYIISESNDFDLMAKANRIKSTAKSLSEDSGVDALYLVLMVIEWKESPDSKELYKAPLLMVPTTLNKENSYSYTFNPAEDEIILNQALKIHFEKNFNIKLPELIENNERYDIDLFIDQVKLAVSQEEFKIKDEAYFGIFAFSKLPMYKDIENNFNSLVNNDFVKLITGGEYVLKENNLDLEKIEKNLDKLSTSSDNHIVVNADASQLKAIEMAKKGHSFVIQGPPGTGKSQTITNMIAELIAQGKKVLFVSEKMAALNVVHSNLSKVNLGEFCLILHSTKTKKDVVINDLYESMIADKTQAHNQESVILKRDQIRSDLSNYVELIHEKNSKLGLSIFNAISRFYSYDDEVPYLYLHDFVKFGLKESDDLISLLNDFVTFTSLFDPNPSKNPLYGFTKNISFENEILTNQYWNEIQENFETLTKLMTYLLELDLQTSSVEIDDIKKLNKKMHAISFEDFAKLTDINEYWFSKNDFSTVFNNLSKIKEAVEVFTEFNSNATIKLKVDALSISTSLIEELISISKHWNWWLIPSYYFQKKKLQSFFENKVDRSFIRNNLPHVLKLQKSLQLLNNFQQEFIDLFDVNINDLAENFEIIEQKIRIFSSIKENYDSLEKWNSTFVSKPIINGLNHQNFIEVGEIIIKIKQKLEFIGIKLQNIEKIYDRSLVKIANFKLNQFKTLINDVGQNIEDYPQWVKFSKLFEQIESKNLHHFLDFIFDKKGEEVIFDSFRKSFYYSWAKYLIEKNNILSSFFSQSHEQKIKEFARLDLDIIEHNRYRIRQKVSENKPNFNESYLNPASEQGLLAREYGKKRNKFSVRKLFAHIPNLIKEIKPVIMMSPITVANYLKYGDFKFDTLIFDEASQIFPYDAIGCLARANQVIIAGDREQLPPTNFFLNADDNNEDEDKDDNETNSTEFESILDLADSRFNKVGLMWHYRSKNEDLIAFSNQEIYKRKLITFPSIHDGIKHQGVEFEYVNNGIYDRGKSKTNRQEADKIIELIVNHIKQTPSQSLGVVTVNSSQQELIENLLTKRVEGSHILEDFVNGVTNPGEPFFIKNIESVQGDERDTIIFGIGYGKDQGGHFNMQFGPINKAGGERRLNVAITRAKVNMKVVASVRGNEFRITESTPRGVRLLSNYLDYAEKGPSVLPKFVSNNEQESESAFEEEVAEFLNRKGFLIEKQVGVSSFRIDLAVRDPQRPKIFALGIECDGATYHSGKTARDRDSLRQKVLEKLGWKIYRIWSTDWFRNPEKAKKNLLEAIDLVLNKKKDNQETKLENPKEKMPSEIKLDKPKLSFIEYKKSDKKVHALCERYGFLYDEPLYEGFSEILKTIMETESPIHKKRLHYLFKRYFSRTASPIYIKNRVNDLLENSIDESIVKIKKDNEFYILAKQNDFPFRKTKDFKRDINEVFPMEIFDLVKTLIQYMKIVSYESLIDLILDHCNYETKSQKAKDDAEYIIKLLISERLLERKGENVFLKVAN